MELNEKKRIDIYVEGLKERFETFYSSDSLTMGADELDPAINRILQFAARYCIDSEDNIVHFIFKAENGIPIEDFSFSAALESMLLGMDPEIVCTGDSCPNVDYLVERNMSPESIALKMDAFESHVYYIKADTSTSSAIILPSNVRNVS